MSEVTWLKKSPEKKNSGNASQGTKKPHSLRDKNIAKSIYLSKQAELVKNSFGKEELPSKGD